MAAGNNVAQVTLFVAAAVEGILALILLIIVAIQLGGEGSVPDASTTPVPAAITTLDMMTDGTASEMEDLYDGDVVLSDPAESNRITGELRALYRVLVAIYVFYMLLSIMILIGIRLEMKALVRSHLDANILLSLLAVVVYILAVGVGTNVDKYFVALMAFFIILRMVTIALEIKCRYHLNMPSFGGPTVEYKVRNSVDHITVTTDIPL